MRKYAPQHLPAYEIVQDVRKKFFTEYASEFEAAMSCRDFFAELKKKRIAWRKERIEKSATRIEELFQRLEDEDRHRRELREQMEAEKRAIEQANEVGSSTFPFDAEDSSNSSHALAEHQIANAKENEVVEPEETENEDDDMPLDQVLSSGGVQKNVSSPPRDLSPIIDLTDKTAGTGDSQSGGIENRTDIIDLVQETPKTPERVNSVIAKVAHTNHFMEYYMTQEIFL